MVAGRRQHQQRRQQGGAAGAQAAAAGAAALLAVMLLLSWPPGSLAMSQAMKKSAAGMCPNICEALPEKQRSAAGLAVSMVALTSCAGDVEGAARAVASAAVDGDLETFSAGFSVGSAAVSGPDDSGRGQVAEIISETLTTASSRNKTTGVASALGSALASLSGAPAEQLAKDTVAAINDVAADVNCTTATAAAASIFFSVKAANPGLAAFLLKAADADGDACWVRRLTKLKNSPVFNMPPPTAPCTRRMQAASAVSVSLVTASACRATASDPVAAAAFALVTAATNDGCSFASAVAQTTMQGVARDAVKDVYTQAITQAGKDRSSQQLANAFVAAYAQLEPQQGGDVLIDNLLGAVAGTIKVSGCDAAKQFTRGLYERLAAVDPDNAADLKQRFKARGVIAACKFGL